MKHYKTLIFDLDDTLIDFYLSEEDSLKKIHTEHFNEHSEFDEFVQRYHDINKPLWQQVSAGKILPKDVKHKRFEELVKAHNSDHDPIELANLYEYHLGRCITWFPGAEDLLKTLAEHFTVGIITNGLESVQSSKIELLNLNEHCASIIISDQVGLAKPDPRIFDMALEELNAEKYTTLMIGDSLPSDYQGAINAGLDFCWLNLRQRELGTFAQPKFVIEDIRELEKLLLTSKETANTATTID